MLVALWMVKKLMLSTRNELNSKPEARGLWKVKSDVMVIDKVVVNKRINNPTAYADTIPDPLMMNLLIRTGLSIVMGWSYSILASLFCLHLFIFCSYRYN